MEIEEEVLEMEDMLSASADENASGQANTSASPVYADVTPQSEENDVQLPVLRDQNNSNIAPRITLGRTEIPDSEAFSELSGLAEFIANLAPPGTSHVNHEDPPDQAIEISNEDPELQPLLDIASPVSGSQAEVGTMVEQVEKGFGAEPSSSMLSLAVAAVKGLQELGTFVLNGEVRELGSMSGSRRDAEFPTEEVPEQPEALPSNIAVIQTYEGLEVDVDNTELESIPEFKMMESEEPEKQEMKVDPVSVDLQKDFPADLHVASNISDVASLDVERATLEVRKSTQDSDMERELGKYTLKPEETIACFSEHQYGKIHQVAGSGEGNLENLENSNVSTISIPEDLMDGMEDHTIIEDTHATNSEELSQLQIEPIGTPAIGLENSPNRASEISTLCEKASVLEDGVTIEHSQGNGHEGHSTNATNTYIEPAVETESSVPAEFMLVDDINNNALPSTSKAVVEEFSAFPVLVRGRSPLPQGDVQMLDNDTDPGEASEESFIRAMATSSVEAPPSTHSPTQNKQSHAAMEAQPEHKEPVINMAPNPVRSSDDVEKPLEVAENEHTNTSVAVRKEDPETLAEPRLGEDVLMPDAIADRPAAFKDDFRTTADADAQEEISSLQTAVVEEKFVIPDSEDESMTDSSAPNSENDVETVNAIPAAALQHAPILEEAAAMHAQITVLVAADVLEPSQSANNDIPMMEASITQQKGGAAEVKACVNDAQETFVTASEEKEEVRTNQKRVIQDSDDEDEASEELEQSPMLPSAYHKSSEIASEPTDNLKAPVVEPVIVESKEAQFIRTPSSSPKVEVALPAPQKTRPKTLNTSFKLPTINKEKQSQTPGIQSSPVKSEISNSSPSKPIQASGATEGPQYEDPVMRELITMKIASIKARNAALTAEIETKRAKLEEISKDLTQPAAETVKRHIKLLHDYNDIKDVGQALIGMIADNRGVRIGELYEEFGVDLKD